MRLSEENHRLTRLLTNIEKPIHASQTKDFQEKVKSKVTA
jgi:hypothetical protein